MPLRSEKGLLGREKKISMAYLKYKVCSVESSTYNSVLKIPLSTSIFPGHIKRTEKDYLFYWFPAKEPVWGFIYKH